MLATRVQKSINWLVIIMAVTAAQNKSEHLIAVAPMVVEVRRRPERIVPPTVFIRAIDESNPAEPSIRLTVLMADEDEEAMLVKVLTNNDRFAFLLRVLRQHFGRHASIRFQESF